MLKVCQPATRLPDGYPLRKYCSGNLEFFRRLAIPEEWWPGRKISKILLAEGQGIRIIMGIAVTNSRSHASGPTGEWKEGVSTAGKTKVFEI